MLLGDRLRQLREQKNLSQGDIEKRTGLTRAYISRVEGGHTVPFIGTLEKFARALEIPMYQLFYEGDEPPPITRRRPRTPLKAAEPLWGSSGKGAELVEQFRRNLKKLEQKDLNLLSHMARKLAKSKL
jgi:transcriptional regulator with XRE-family HTH domain